MPEQPCSIQNLCARQQPSVRLSGPATLYRYCYTACRSYQCASPAYPMRLTLYLCSLDEILLGLSDGDPLPVYLAILGYFIPYGVSFSHVVTPPPRSHNQWPGSSYPAHDIPAAALALGPPSVVLCEHLLPAAGPSRENLRHHCQSHLRPTQR